MLPRSIPLALLCPVLVVSLGGCRSVPEPDPGLLAQPALNLRDSYAPGDVLAGPGLARDEAPSAAPPVALRCRLLYLERPLAGALEPLEVLGALAVDLQGKTPVLEVARFVAGGRVGAGPAAEAWLAALARGEAGRARELFGSRPLLFPGATYTVEATAFETVEDPRDWLDEFPDRGPIEREVTFTLAADADGVRLAVGVSDLDPLEEARRLEEQLDDGPRLPGPPPPEERVLVRRETFLLDRLLAPGETLVATLPSPFAEGAGRSFALVVEPDGEAPAAERVAAVEAALARVAEDHARRTGPITVAEVLDLLERQALIAFEERGSRAALLLLAAEADATVAEGLGLTASDEFIAALAARVFAVDPAEVARDIGWNLESAAWRLLCERVLENEAAAEYRGPLLRNAGALADFPDVVLDALAASGSLAELRARLAEEQRYFLEDPSPPTRMRANDWLVARGLAVEGYDPLAPSDERRAALERAREAAEAAAAEEAAETDE